MFSPQDLQEKSRQIDRALNVFRSFQKVPLDIVSKVINNQMDLVPANHFPIFKADASSVSDVPPQITRCLPFENMEIIQKDFGAVEIHKEIERYGLEHA